MSVINQMLNDIEQRENAPQEEPSPKLDYVDIKEPDPRRRWIVAVIIMLTFSALIWWSLEFFASKNNGVELAQVETQGVQQPLVLANSDDAVRKPILPQDEVVQQSITNQQPAFPSTISNVQKEEPSQADLLPAIMMQQIPPAQPIKQALTVRKLNNKPVLDKITAKVPVSRPTLSITPVKLTALELAQLKYRQGLKQQGSGDIETAQQSWQQSLRAQPSFHQARESLAASYYGAQQTNQALGILEQGSNAYPQYQGYRVLMAQILFKQQRLKLALAALEKPYMNSRSSDESLALAGSIAQTLSLWTQAEQNYRVLNLRDPINDKWLISLAISLDGQGKINEAQTKYRQFLQLSNTDLALGRYAKERLRQLDK